jgi:polyisoprenoid-binding protein YceI
MTRSNEIGIPAKDCRNRTKNRKMPENRLCDTDPISTRPSFKDSLRAALCLILLAAAAVIAGPPERAFGSPARYVTNQSLSKAEFQLSIAMFELEGRVGKFSSALDLDPADFTRSKLTFEADLSSITVEPGGFQGDLGLDRIFEQIPSPVVSFQSTGIVRIGPKRYEARGILSRKGKQWNARIPLEVLQLSGGRPEIRVVLSSVFSEWDPDIPLPVKPGRDRGELSAHLRYRR